MLRTQSHNSLIVLDHCGAEDDYEDDGPEKGLTARGKKVPYGTED